ncbi:MAG: hypothetical protein NWR54_08085, partial [Paracoccaceae bacterium]|nr:hypothetical protein [Paracoccaceae bacterium]
GTVYRRFESYRPSQLTRGVAIYRMVWRWLVPVTRWVRHEATTGYGRSARENSHRFSELPAPRKVTAPFRQEDQRKTAAIDEYGKYFPKIHKY